MKKSLKRKAHDILNNYNNSLIRQTNLPIDEQNDMIIDKVINEYMDLDWELPDLDNKCIVIETYTDIEMETDNSSPNIQDISKMEIYNSSSNIEDSSEMDTDNSSDSSEMDTNNSSDSSEMDTDNSSDSSEMDTDNSSSNTEDSSEMEIETESGKCNGFTIKIYKDTIENYIEDYIENYEKNDENTILIPALNDEPTTDRSLSEEIFSKFLNTYILKFNRRSKEIQIEYFNIDRDVIKIDKNGYTNIKNIHLINNLYKTKSLLVFIPIKILYSNNSHYNVLVIDKQKNTFTYYEPYGDYYNFYMGSVVNTGLEEIKTYLLNKYQQYTYIDAHITNKDKTLGVQKRSEGFFHISEGYCVAWCLYLCYIRMFNFHLNTQFSISTLLNKVFEEYTDLNLLSTIKSFITFVKTEIKS
jgi:hypothetical protein